MTNTIASGSLGAPVDLEEVHERVPMDGRLIYKPEQFPAAMYRIESPRVVFLMLHWQDCVRGHQEGGGCLLGCGKSSAEAGEDEGPSLTCMKQ
ncbi:MAG: hypothetical protein QMD23_02780 [Candidatus Bathyarchaeia archaeon]|nr:hypothetical protein [Candidatus Bathyarchaeia archaeon]